MQWVEPRVTPEHPTMHRTVPPPPPQQRTIFSTVSAEIEELCPKLLRMRFLFYTFYLFIYFWLRWLFVPVRGLSLVVASRGYSSLRCAGFSLRWLLFLQSMGSRRVGFSSCGMQDQQLWLVGSRAQAQQLWHTGLVAARHVGSSQTRA